MKVSAFGGMTKQRPLAVALLGAIVQDALKSRRFRQIKTRSTYDTRRLLCLHSPQRNVRAQLWHRRRCNPQVHAAANNKSGSSSDLA